MSKLLFHRHKFELFLLSHPRFLSYLHQEANIKPVRQWHTYSVTELFPFTGVNAGVDFSRTFPNRLQHNLSPWLSVKEIKHQRKWVRGRKINVVVLGWSLWFYHPPHICLLVQLTTFSLVARLCPHSVHCLYHCLNTEASNCRLWLVGFRCLTWSNSSCNSADNRQKEQSSTVGSRLQLSVQFSLNSSTA